MDDDTFLLPGGDPGNHQPEKTENPAADLIRKKVDDAYKSEPSAAAEIEEAKDLNKSAAASKHQKFIHELSNSGKTMEDIQVAWHDYYAGLTDVEKHQVWHEFYSAQASSSKHPAIVSKITSSKKLEHTHPKQPIKLRGRVASATKTLADMRGHALRSEPKNRTVKRKGPIHSLAFGIGIGAIVIFILLFGFFNERFIAPFIQPSRSLSDVPLIVEGSAIGPNPEVIIPKINVEIPVVYDVNTINESSVDKGLEQGVVHYADTAVPGQNGNVVIVGHSSNNIFNKGRYKFAFVLLKKLELGDTFYLQKDGKRYTYQVYQKKIVKPDDVSVLGLSDKKATATLITCDPPGTSINRLVITAEQINPDPSKNAPASNKGALATQSVEIPGNSQTLWARLLNSFGH